MIFADSIASIGRLSQLSDEYRKYWTIFSSIGCLSQVLAVLVDYRRIIAGLSHDYRILSEYYRRIINYVDEFGQRLFLASQVLVTLGTRGTDYSRAGTVYRS